MKTIAMVLIGLLLCAAAWAQEAKPDMADVAVASGPVTVCGDSNGKSECEKRDIARLFLIAGKPEAALFMLCNTKEARAAFRDDYQDGHNWIQADVPTKCLRAVGLAALPPK